MAGNQDKNQPRGERSVLGDKEKFKKDEAPDDKKNEQAKEEIGHMGEASRQNKHAKDVR